VPPWFIYFLSLFFAATRRNELTFCTNDMLGQYQKLYNQAAKLIAILDKECPGIKN